jgi:hypothetical protein
MIEIEPEDKDLIHDLVDALPRLKQYRLTESQRIFLEKLEAMLTVAEHNTSLEVNEMIQ